MLEVRQLHLWRGELHLLRGLAFTLGTGQALQLLWPNGTGKTSLLRCIAGLLHPESGELSWNGASTTGNRDGFHRDLAYLGHEPALKADLTAEENLRYSVGLRRHVRRATELREALAAVGLSGLDPEQPARSLSAGQRKRVALARLSLWGARLWLLDEPATNLDVQGQAVLGGVLRRHLDSGGAILLATHTPISLGEGVDSRLWSSPEAAP